MVAIDDQQTANNLLDDVQEKIPSETAAQKEEVSLFSAEAQLIKEKKKTTELIENSPITIPISTDPPKKVASKNKWSIF